MIQCQGATIINRRSRRSPPSRQPLPHTLLSCHVLAEPGGRSGAEHVAARLSRRLSARSIPSVLVFNKAARHPGIKNTGCFINDLLNGYLC